LETKGTKVKQPFFPLFKISLLSLLWFGCLYVGYPKKNKKNLVICFSLKMKEIVEKMPSIMIERPKMPRATWEALRAHIVRERLKKKQEQEQNQEVKKVCFRKGFKTSQIFKVSLFVLVQNFRGPSNCISWHGAQEKHSKGAEGCLRAITHYAFFG
jgi:hypothetical protein